MKMRLYEIDSISALFHPALIKMERICTRKTSRSNVFVGLESKQNAARIQLTCFCLKVQWLQLRRELLLSRGPTAVQAVMGSQEQTGSRQVTKLL
jgi:hypothetical protein